MATYTAKLSRNNTALATYYAPSVIYDSSTYSWSPFTITPPKWNSGRKEFSGYYGGESGNIEFITSGGIVLGAPSITKDVTLTEKWKTLSYAAVVNTGSSPIAEIVYDGGVWYQDFVNRTPFDADHPFVPTRAGYRFLGCYSTNATTGTQVVDADGKPTAAFPTNEPTKDVTIYAQWEKVSYKVTLKHSLGSPASTVFYYKIDAGGFYSDYLCTIPISSITPPQRQLYRWNGAFSSSSQTEANRYVNSDGTFTANLTGLTLTGDKEINYANYWTQLSRKVTVNANGGTAPVANYYVRMSGGGVFADWLAETPELLDLPIPTRAANRFLGYFNSSSGSTKYVEYDGTIQSNLKSRTADTTIVAKWRAADATVTLDAGRGTGGGSLYYDSANVKFFDSTSATVTSVPVPTYPGNTFIGYFDAQTGGTQVISAAGVIDQSYVPDETATLYAQYSIGKTTVNVDFGEGSGGTERFFYDHTTQKFYADDEMTDEISSVMLPTMRLFNTNGLFTEATGGSTVVTASGTISAPWHPTEEFETLYAQYTRRCFEVSIDVGEGTLGYSAIYHSPSGSTWFADDTLDTPITNVGVPVRTGYTFGGCFYGDTQVIGSNGSILSAALTDTDYAASAKWTANTYTLTFNAYPATPSFVSKTVTFGAQIGTFPTATIPARRLDGWSIDGSPIDKNTVWTFDADKTATASWHDGFGGSTDFFRLETANGPLMLVASNPGATRTVIETSHAGALAIQNGDSSVGAFKTFGLLLNPTCTYRIRKKGSVTISLGAAWKGSGETKSGYMLVSAEYATAADGEPVLVVRGAANEGAPAINRWTVNLYVSPDHVAQDPMNAVTGGGELTDCKTLVTCDPVVPMENGMPCASDIVHGKVVVTATTNAYGGENAPTARLPFVETNGVPSDETDVDFTTYAFTAERSL